MSTWVLLRGLARERRHWGDFPGTLQDHLPPGSRLFTPELPGNGELARQRSPATVPGMVEAYRAQLRGTAGPYVLLGLSLGAMVAASWAVRHAGEVAGCVLVNGSAAGLQPAWQRLLPRAWPALVTATLPGRSALARERAILGACSNLPHEGVDARWASYALQSPTSGPNAARQLFAALRFRLAPAAPAAPVLVLASACDRLVASACSEAIARRWGAPLVLHPSAGHELALDAPGWLARQCATFEQSRILHACHANDAEVP